MGFISIGHTLKTFGVKGEIKIEVSPSFLSDLEKAPAVFFLEKGKHLPYFIQSVKTGNQPVILLEDISSKEAAHRFNAKEIFLRASDIDPAHLEVDEYSDLEYGQLIGYTIVDSNQGKIGVIDNIEEYPQQEMAAVKRGDDFILIPLNEYFILEIDEKKREVLMELPEGLVEI